MTIRSTNTLRTLRRGVSLIELMMVIVIMSISATVFVAMSGNSIHAQANTAAQQVSGALLFAQTCAISAQQPYQVVFDSDAGSYEVQDVNGDVIATTVNTVLGGSSDAVDGVYRVVFSENSHLHGVEITSVSFDGSGIVWFDPLGTPYSGDIGSPTPLTSGSVVLSAGDNSVTISVEPVTGRVTIAGS